MTLKRVIFAFEALFLIRVVSVEGEGKPTIFLEDQGMASWLKGSALENADDIVRGLYANLRQEYHYRPDRGAKITQWRTDNGVEIPLVFVTPKNRLGFIATLNEQPTPKTLGSAQSFLKMFPNSRVVVAYGGSKIIYKTPSMFWIPYWLLT